MYFILFIYIRVNFITDNEILKAHTVGWKNIYGYIYIYIYICVNDVCSIPFLNSFECSTLNWPLNPSLTTWLSCMRNSFIHGQLSDVILCNHWSWWRSQFLINLRVSQVFHAAKLPDPSCDFVHFGACCLIILKWSPRETCTRAVSIVLEIFVNSVKFRKLYMTISQLSKLEKCILTFAFSYLVQISLFMTMGNNHEVINILFLFPIDCKYVLGGCGKLPSCSSVRFCTAFNFNFLAYTKPTCTFRGTYCVACT